jgi:hypothetical protein
LFIFKKIRGISYPMSEVWRAEPNYEIEQNEKKG